MRGVVVLLGKPMKVWIGNVAIFAPAAKVTLAGTVAVRGRLVKTGTTSPPAGAGFARMIVPVAGDPAGTVSGETRIESVSGSGAGGGAFFALAAGAVVWSDMHAVAINIAAAAASRAR
jgi:hypothetical protein